MGLKKEYTATTVFIEDEDYERMNSYCEGKMYKSVFIRKAIKKLLDRAYGTKEEKTDKKKIIKIAVDNYDELLEYVREKKLSDISVFATYAMAQHMARYPTNKVKIEKTLNEA